MESYYDAIKVEKEHSGVSSGAVSAATISGNTWEWRFHSY